MFQLEIKWLFVEEIVWLMEVWKGKGCIENTDY